MRNFCVVLYVAAVLFVLTANVAQADDWPGLVKIRSAHDVEETTRRLQAALDGAGMRQFAVIDHAAGAQSVNLPIHPNQCRDIR